MMLYGYYFSLLFFSFCTLLVSLLIWLKRRDQIGFYYLIFSFSVVGWGVGMSFVVNPYINDSMALFASRICNLSALFIAPTWYHFALVFTKVEKPGRSMILRGAYLFFSVLACFSFTKWFVPSVGPTTEFSHYTQAGVLFHIFMTVFYIVVGLGFYRLLKKHSELKGTERLQAQGFIAATGLGFLGGGVAFVTVYFPNFPQYSFFCMPFYPFIVAYFMIKKNLFNEHELAYAAHRDKLAAMGTLAASINHEIKNPLYIIKGLAEGHLANLNDNVYSDEKHAFAKANEILQKAALQSDRAMQIMRHFAAFAKKSSSEDPRPEAVDLKQLIEELLPLIQYELKLEKVELKVEVPQNFLLLQMDRHHLEEILFNIIVNACQAMKSGGEICIRAGVENNRANICIQDNGPGISPEGVKKIFEPFYTTKEEGTGLGLHITKRLVEVNGGKIRVESQTGQGTKFILEFQSALTHKEGK